MNRLTRQINKTIEFGSQIFDDGSSNSFIWPRDNSNFYSTFFLRIHGEDLKGLFEVWLFKLSWDVWDALR